jgi:hypothetical protein
MKAQTMRRVRQYHLYVGVFFAPALLLFSISGALQTFRIPDQPGAASWIVWIASFHKDQAPPREKSTKPKPHHEPSPDEQKQRAARPNPLPLKIFVLLMALGLITSTLLGLTIALNNRATRRSTIALLIAGAVLPCVLLWL